MNIVFDDRILSFFSYSVVRKTYFYNVVLNNAHLVDICCDENVSSIHSVRFVELLLRSRNVDPRYDNSACLCYASRRNHVDIVKSLIKDGRVNVSCNMFYCMRIALARGYDELCELLFEENFPRLSDTAYQLTVNVILQYDRHILFDKLLLMGKITLSKINTGIIVINDSYKILRSVINFIKRECIDSEQIIKFNSLLRKIAYHGNIKMLRILMKEININDVNICGIISEAAENGHHLIVSLLLHLITDVSKIISSFRLILFIDEKYPDEYPSLIIKLRSRGDIINDYIKTIKVYINDGRIDIPNESSLLIKHMLNTGLLDNYKLIEFLLPICDLRQTDSFSLFFQVIKHFNQSYILDALMNNKLITGIVAKQLLQMMMKNHIKCEYIKKLLLNRIYVESR